MQTSVIQPSARLQPFKHQSLLVGSWIDSISVIHSQHLYILAEKLKRDKTISLTGDSSHTDASRTDVRLLADQANLVK